MKNSLSTIFFDVGNTLLFPNRDRILRPLHERDLAPTPEQWRQLEASTKNEFDDILTHAGRADHSFWFMFYTHLLEELRLQDAQVRDSLVEATRTSANWDVIRPGTDAVLREIGKHYQMGVISNADGKITSILEHCGIAGCFQSITDSGVVGCEKPDPVIFQAALQAMGAQPEHSLYVGDVYSVDYLGATRAGMQAILFDAAGAYRDKGLPRAETLEELQEYLEI